MVLGLTCPPTLADYRQCAYFDYGAWATAVTTYGISGVAQLPHLTYPDRLHGNAHHIIER
jgi:hypothetical protein